MQFACPCCVTGYAVPTDEIPRGYFKVVCSHCSYKWRKAIGIKTKFYRHRVDLGQEQNHPKIPAAVKPVHRPEVLAILREEAAVETRLRRS